MNVKKSIKNKNNLSKAKRFAVAASLFLYRPNAQQNTKQDNIKKSLTRAEKEELSGKIIRAINKGAVQELKSLLGDADLFDLNIRARVGYLNHLPLLSAVVSNYRGAAGNTTKVKLLDEIVTLLVNAGGLTTMKDQEIKSLVWDMIEYDVSNDIIKLILSNPEGKRFRKPSMFILDPFVRRNDIEMVKFLINKSDSWVEQDKFKALDEGLETAVEEGNIEMTKLLIKSGARAAVQSVFNSILWDYFNLEGYGDVKMIKLLIDNGAVFDKETQNLLDKRSDIYCLLSKYKKDMSESEQSPRLRSILSKNKIKIPQIKRNYSARGNDFQR